MSLSNELVAQFYDGDGSTTSFAIPFDFEAGTHEDVVEVYEMNETTGALTLKALTTDYTLDPLDAPVNVVMVTAPANTKKILVKRASDKVQAGSYIDTGPFAAATHEKLLDRVVRMVQEIWDSGKKGIRLHPYVDEADFSPILPFDIAANPSTALVVNAAGDALETGPSLADISGAAAAATAAAASAAAAAASAAAALASTGFTGQGPFTVTENTNSDLALVLFDHTVYTQVDFIARVIRGATVFARVTFSIFYRNGAWELVEDQSLYAITAHGVTFTVNASTGQINAAVDNSGAGNAVITLKEIPWAA